MEINRSDITIDKTEESGTKIRYSLNKSDFLDEKIPNQIIDKFMWLKHFEINRCANHYINYYNIEDSQEILNMSVRMAEGILSQIEGSAFKYGVDSRSCPFCYLYDIECRKCSYGKRHGICERPSSDYGNLPPEARGSLNWRELFEQAKKEVMESYFCSLQTVPEEQDKESTENHDCLTCCYADWDEHYQYATRSGACCYPLPESVMKKPLHEYQNSVYVVLHEQKKKIEKCQCWKQK